VNLESFQIREAVVHDVPRGGDEEQAPILTDAPIALDGPLRAYFRRKILKSLGLRGLEVVVDPDGAACVRDGIAEILADRYQLVPVSRRMAEHLHAIQTGRNSAGLLTTLLGEIDGGECVSVLKLEREQGLRFHINVDERGRTRLESAEVGRERITSPPGFRPRSYPR
jgi:hypothetical protein